jgi:toxin YoeB
MNITFSKNAWEDYVSWQKEDKKILRKINLAKRRQKNPQENKRTYQSHPTNTI